MTMKMILILQLLKNYFLLNEKDMEMLEIYMINLQIPLSILWKKIFIFIIIGEFGIKYFYLIEIIAIRKKYLYSHLYLYCNNYININIIKIVNI